jgi:hypothetical protein
LFGKYAHYVICGGAFEIQTFYDAFEGKLSHLGIAHNLVHFDVELVIVWQLCGT